MSSRSRKRRRWRQRGGRAALRCRAVCGRDAGARRGGRARRGRVTGWCRRRQLRRQQADRRRQVSGAYRSIHIRVGRCAPTSFEQSIDERGEVGVAVQHAITVSVAAQRRLGTRRLCGVGKMNRSKKQHPEAHESRHNHCRHAGGRGVGVATRTTTCAVGPRLPSVSRSRTLNRESPGGNKAVVAAKSQN